MRALGEVNWRIILFIPFYSLMALTFQIIRTPRKTVEMDRPKHWVGNIKDTKTTKRS